MLAIQHESFYIVEVPMDQFVVGIERPFASQRKADAVLAPRHKACPESEQVLYCVTGEWLADITILQCESITAPHFDHLVLSR